MDDHEPARPTEWVFALMALVTAPVFIAIAYFTDDVFPLLMGAGTYLYGISRVALANWRP